MKSWRAWVRWIAIAVYLLAIPVSALLAVGAVFVTDEGSALPWRWSTAAAAFAMTALLSWRLWLNLRASRAVPVTPAPGWVLLALGLLALCGAAFILAGIAYIGFSSWLLTSSIWDAAVAPPMTTNMRIVSLVATTAMGLLAVAVGMLMTWPLLRRMRRTPG